MHKKLDPSVTHWDDKKRATRMTKKEHWHDSSPTSYRDSFAVSLGPANK
ncbi:hypothetical protein [Wolbachia endosymbiont (group A) of Agelastica alni]